MPQRKRNDIRNKAKQKASCVKEVKLSSLLPFMRTGIKVSVMFMRNDNLWRHSLVERNCVVFTRFLNSSQIIREKRG